MELLHNNDVRRAAAVRDAGSLSENRRSAKKAGGTL